ncbi:hypothetical protein RHECNPAF_1700058 [Rhizobium etli CNPAF512]|nr:hypothetical protein RHECNPAF_1700058 [Rhizobium etli CNPAF512]
MGCSRHRRASERAPPNLSRI